MTELNSARYFGIAGLYIIGTWFLSSAAIYNRFPLIYPDSGSYLQAFIEWHNLPERPIFYSIFIGLLHWRLSLWPIVIGQSILTIFVIERTLTHLVPRVGLVAKLTVMAILSLATSLPWFAGQIMADLFAPVMVLALFLTVVERHHLAKWEYYTLLLILCVTQASHYTHISIALGLLACLAVAALVFGAPKLRSLLPVALTSAVAILAIMTVNFAARSEVVFAPYGSVFLLDRLIAYGTAQDYLTQHCPSLHYNICDYLDEIKQQPRQASWLLWHDDSILPKMGGAEHYKREADRLVRAIVLDAPAKYIALVLGATIRQFFNFGTGLELPRLGEGMQIYRIVMTYFPSQADAYIHSRQYLGQLNLDLINRIDIPVAYASLFALIWLLGLGIAKHDVALIIFCSVIFLALLGNAILCGGLSAGEARYQSRVISLVPFAAAVGFLRMRVRSKMAMDSG